MAMRHAARVRISRKRAAVLPDRAAGESVNDMNRAPWWVVRKQGCGRVPAAPLSLLALGVVPWRPCPARPLSEGPSRYLEATAYGFAFRRATMSWMAR